MLLELLYPSLCPVCNKKADEPYQLCPTCNNQLPRTEHALLRQNKVETVFEPFNHPNRQRIRHRFIRGGAWLNYRDEVPTLICNAKYYRQPEINRHLARQAATEWQESGFFESIDVLVPVPLHKDRERKRGYNQSESICSGISEVTGIPIDNHSIKRVIDTRQQARMPNHQARQENIKGAFRIEAPEALKNKHILIVDDIITTGATITEMIRAIIPFRTIRVSVFTLAVAF